jgi:hypothetical protein
MNDWLVYRNPIKTPGSRHQNPCDSGDFGGDDGLGGYMPLAVSTPDPIAGAGATRLSWVHANHMGVPLRYSDAAGQTLNPPSSYP